MPAARARISPFAFFAVAAAVLLVGYVYFRRTPEPAPTVEEEWSPVPDSPPPDPREAFTTIFRNVKPTVQYLGSDARCAGCHPKHTQGYHGHPMGRSAGTIGEVATIERFDDAARPRFTRDQFTLKAEGGVHRVKADGVSEEYAIRAEIAIGSGTRGRSYLANESGAVWQSPVSWFTGPGHWDLSPGFDLSTGGRRAIIAECLFCHVDRVEPVRGSVNRFREPLLRGQAAIGCERCHGPGELHVAERTAAPPRAGEPDTSIVNPKHLSAALQASICAQCHLQGQARIPRRGRDLFEYRPGLPLEEFITVFVRHPDLADLQRSVGQFEQMERSHCFTASNGKLTCSTCHDPHSYPAQDEKRDHYRTQCVQCHAADGRTCSAPAPAREAKSDSCFACHMPRAESTNIAHASVTDHRILRKPMVASPPSGLSPGQSPLVPFSLGSSPTAEVERELGIALARLSGSAGPNGRGIAKLANDRLGASLKQWPGDSDAWLASSLAQSAEEEREAAWRSASRAAALAPDSEIALTTCAEAAIALRKFEEAATLAARVIAMNPSAVEPRLIRAVALLGEKDWGGAGEECRRALKIHPLHAQAKLLHAVCLHRLGDAAAGRAEAEFSAKLAGLERRESYLRWYLDQTR